jgi:hypothetical protein
MAAQAEGLQQLVSHFRLTAHEGTGRTILAAAPEPAPAPAARSNGSGRGATSVAALAFHPAGHHDRDFKAF